MPIRVEFIYQTGLAADLFRNARLQGSWDDDGRYCDVWSEQAMVAGVAEDGCACFRATVVFHDRSVGQSFQWGVLLDGPLGPNVWGIADEVRDPRSSERVRQLTLRPDHREERYHLTTHRWLGANKHVAVAGRPPALRFSVWAPNAQAVEVVFGDLASAYIADDGTGAVSAPGQYPMRRTEDGVWETEISSSSDLADFATFLHRPYMYRVTKDDGEVAYRTDLYSRCQAGIGTSNPKTEPFSGRRQDLDGTVGCSVVVDPDRITRQFREGVWPETDWQDAGDFWRDELDPLRPLPTRIEDLVIYELHIGALGFGSSEPGRLSHALELLDHLVDLGVNAVELLPLAEFRGWANWGYATSHYFAIEFSGGGRDQLKHFIRACHRRGIAVLADVVYNHYHHDAERAEWMYDSNAHEKNVYYWYEGKTTDYAFERGGYVENGSTGDLPRLHEEKVRHLFISSAAMLLTEFHVDGFRVDLADALHSTPTVIGTGQPANDARVFGQKLLRQWSRTLRMIKPNVMLMAEDHSGWPAVTRSPELDGLGFDAIWFSAFYHHLIGDACDSDSYARLLVTAGAGGSAPLAMGRFAHVLAETGMRRIVYHESHDEAGNSNGGRSCRTLVAALNRAPVTDDNRPWAEARSRFAFGMSLLSAATPLFFMGEEVGAEKPYRHDDFLNNKEDLAGQRRGKGRFLFRFYQDLIALRKRKRALRGRTIRIVHTDDASRVLVFERGTGPGRILVLASLNDQAFDRGYAVPAGIEDGSWREIFNSDAQAYRGAGIGNGGGALQSAGGRFEAVLPANGFVVFQHE
jgi:1,4-alpha-glucan branching enzyme